MGEEKQSPWVSVSAPGRRVTVRVLRDPIQRARPDKSVGAAVYWYAGDVHPESLSGWHLAGNATRPEMSFTLPGTVEPGTKLWVCAAWLDRRLKPGQLSARRKRVWATGSRWRREGGLCLRDAGAIGAKKPPVLQVSGWEVKCCVLDLSAPTTGDQQAAQA